MTAESLKEKDFFYQYLDVYYASRYKAMRQAVLFPLRYQTWCASGISREERRLRLIKAMRSLRFRWHHRLDKLLAAGYEPLQRATPQETETHMSFVRNCPPFGVATKGMKEHRMHTCGLSNLCPFCYARDRVRSTYYLLERVLYGDSDPEAICGRGWWLVEFLATSTYLQEDFTQKQALARITQGLSVPPGQRHRELKAASGVAGVTLYRVEPLKEGWQFQRSGMFLTRTPPKVSQELKPNYQIKVHGLDAVGQPKHLLVEACGRVLAYPRLLLVAPAKKVVDLLHGLQGHRLFSTVGHTHYPRRRPKTIF